MSEVSGATGPRMKGGGPLRHLGRGYYVLTNRAGDEVSDRSYGEAWLGVERPFMLGEGAHTQIFIVPEDTNRDGFVALTANRDAAWVATCLDPEGMIAASAMDAHRGSEVHIEWTNQLEALA